MAQLGAACQPDLSDLSAAMLHQQIIKLFQKLSTSLFFFFPPTLLKWLKQ